MHLNQQYGRRGAPRGGGKDAFKAAPGESEHRRAGRPRPRAWATRPLEAAFMASVPACVTTSLFYSPTLLEIMILSPSSSF